MSTKHTWYKKVAKPRPHQPKNYPDIPYEGYGRVWIDSKAAGKYGDTGQVIWRKPQEVIDNPEEWQLYDRDRPGYSWDYVPRGNTKVKGTYRQWKRFLPFFSLFFMRSVSAFTHP